MQKILQSWLLTSIILLVIVILGINVYNKQLILNRRIKEKERIEEKITQNDHKNTQLLNNSNRDEYLDRQARITLNYKNPDEKVVYIYRNNEKIEQTEYQVNNILEQSKIQIWWDYILGK